MQFLKEFWKGNIIPGETRYRHDELYSKSLQTMEKAEMHLKEVLSEADWKVFSQFSDASQEVSCISDRDSFIEGFRMGAKMMMDVLLEP